MDCEWGQEMKGNNIRLFQQLTSNLKFPSYQLKFNWNLILMFYLIAFYKSNIILDPSNTEKIQILVAIKVLQTGQHFCTLQWIYATYELNPFEDFSPL